MKVDSLERREIGQSDRTHYLLVQHTGELLHSESTVKNCVLILKLSSKVDFECPLHKNLRSHVKRQSSYLDRMDRFTVPYMHTSEMVWVQFPGQHSKMNLTAEGITYSCFIFFFHECIWKLWLRLLG